MAATAIHPHFKERFVTKNFPEKDWTLIQNWLVVKLSMIEEHQNLSVPLQKKIKLDSTFYESDDDEEEATTLMECSINLKKYLQAPISDSPKDISQLLNPELRSIKKLFIELNTRLPSSSSCERLFSSSKLSYSNLRNRLDDPKINEIIFLAVNKH